MEFITREQVRTQAREQIFRLLEERGTITGVARKLNVNKGLVHRVKEGGYSEMVVVALGLPVVKPVEMPMCLECGEIHETKITCDVVRRSGKKRRRKAADLDPGSWGEVQNYALDKFADDCGFKTWTELVVNIAETVIKEMPAGEFEEVTMKLIPEPGEDKKNGYCC